MILFFKLVRVYMASPPLAVFTVKLTSYYPAVIPYRHPHSHAAVCSLDTGGYALPCRMQE